MESSGGDRRILAGWPGRRASTGPARRSGKGAVGKQQQAARIEGAFGAGIAKVVVFEGFVRRVEEDVGLGLGEVGAEEARTSSRLQVMRLRDSRPGRSSHRRSRRNGPGVSGRVGVDAVELDDVSCR
jgi:hypothetical protein